MNIAQTIIIASANTFWLGISATSAFSLFSFYLIFHNIRKARILADTPTSKIRSAAQGYTELTGVAELIKGDPIHAPLSGQLCTWYSYQVEKRKTTSINGRQQTNWQTIEKGTSESIFHLADETGTCIIDPDGAAVTPSVNMSWRGSVPRPAQVPSVHSRNGFASWLTLGTYRYTEKRIHPGDPLYAIGLFVSIGGSHEGYSISDEVRDLLRSWKGNSKELLDRFDLNRDGHIDVKEWTIARRQAEKKVASGRQKQLKQPQLHILKKSTIKCQPFILSTVSQAQLTSRYRSRAFIFMVFFLMLGAAIGWAINLRF